MRFTYQSGSSPLDGYEIKRGVGAGGFGEVYYAVTPGGKEVALKHIQRNLDIEMRGAQHCLNLKHPNLVSLHDIRYDSTGEGWIIMEYIRGENLQEAIEKYPDGMPRETVMQWFSAICQGVGYLHDHGIVHRDLKPGNIFDDAGIIKIGDYGLSKFISLSQRSGQTESIGTVHYMAPEIGKGRYGKEIDIYALGVILYQMVTGRLPFDGESTQEVLYKHMLDPPELQGIEQPFRDVIAKALVKDPDQRTHSATEMLAALSGEGPGVGAANQAGGPAVAPKSDVPAGNRYSAGQDDFVQPLPPAVANQGNSSEEPIAKALGQMVGNFQQWWNNDNSSNLLKIAVLVGGVLVLVSNIGLLIPLGVLLSVSYFTYLLIRAIVMTASQTPEPRFDGEVAAKSPYHPTAMQRKQRAKQAAQWHQSRGKRERAGLALRSPVERLRDVVGSMAVSGLVAALISLLLIGLGGAPLDGPVLEWASLYAWLTGITTLGAWMVLITGKFWEAKPEDPILRRLVMLGLGIVLGVVAWGLLHLLVVDFPAQSRLSHSPFFGHNAPLIIRSMYLEKASISPFLTFFAGLFVILRWWRLADPLRKSRLSLLATGLCVLTALILNAIFPFVQPWGMILAGSIAVTVQIAAPWLTGEERNRIRKRYEQTIQETTVSAA